MGRGLSSLQEQILSLAWEREQDERTRGVWEHPAGGGILFPQDILVRLWQWPITYGRWTGDGRAVWKGHGWHFQPSSIGERAYQAAVVVLSRSLKRLRARGLVERRMKTGLVLTDQGRAVVQQLLVKNPTTAEES